MLFDIEIGNKYYYYYYNYIYCTIQDAYVYPHCHILHHSFSIVTLESTSANTIERLRVITNNVCCSQTSTPTSQYKRQ